MTTKVFWPCEVCGVECYRGVSGIIGRAGKSKHFCLKDYNTKMREKLSERNQYRGGKGWSS